MMEKKPTKPHQKKRLPRKISGGYLENAALHYLQKYATSAENLRRVLVRKIDRSCAAHGDTPEDFYPLVDKLLERYARSGLLNDKLYAEAKVTSLRRQGRSRQAINARLSAKGLSRGDIAAALADVDGAAETDNPELAAALRHARKKKLGPFGPAAPADPDAARKQKQRALAAMARAGFSYETSVAALQFSPDDDSADF